MQDSTLPAGSYAFNRHSRPWEYPNPPVDLDLTASPIRFSLSTAPYLIMAEILSAHQVLLYPSRSEVRSQPHGPGASGREKLCPRRTDGYFVPFATSTLTKKITKLRPNHYSLAQVKTLLRSCGRHIFRRTPVTATPELRI